MSTTETETRRYRAGIIGCGGISAMHAANYQESRAAVLVAAADISPEAGRRFGEQHPGVSTYTSVEEMFRRERLDIASICTPPALHTGPALEAAGSGIRAMLLEKPMALHLEDADRILEQCRANGVTLAIGHQLRCHAPYVTARKLLEDGAIGSLERIWGICHGAPLQTNATHTIDLMRFVAGDGEVAWVLGGADLHDRGPMEGIRQEAAGLGLFQFKDGPIALIESGVLQPYRGYHHIYLDGSEGRIELTPPAGPSLRMASPATGGEWRTPDLLPSINPVDDLVDALESGQPARASGEQGRATLEVILTLFESVRIRRRVDLPLQNRQNPLEQMTR